MNTIHPNVSMLAFATVVALVGCNKLAEAVSDRVEAEANANKNSRSDTSPEAPRAPELTEDDKLGLKLDPYIRCINATSKRVFDTADRYHLWADAKTGPTGKERHVYGLYELKAQTECLEGIADANQLEPARAELEAAAKAYAEAVETVQPLVEEAFEYYDEKNYADDDFALGKSLHAKLEAGFEAFSNADRDLRGAVEVENDGLQLRNLERLEAEEGRNLLFLAKNLMLEAKMLSRSVDATTLDELELAALSEAVDAYEAAVDEFEAYSEAHPSEEGRPLQIAMMESAATKLLKQAKTLARRKRDEQPFSEREASAKAEGHPTQVWAAYDDLVRQSNSLSWRDYRADPS